MRYPAQFITDNLVWSADGGVWAIWRINAVSYPYLSAKEKVRVYHQLRGAFISLPTESMLLSVCRQIDPGAVVERMISDVDITKHPEWKQAALRTLDLLDESEIYDRYFFIAIKLPDEGLKRQVAASGSAATSSVMASFGFTPPPPRRKDLERRRSQAAQYEGQLQTGLSMRPARPAEIRWLYARAAYRGLAEPMLDEDWTPNITETGPGPDASMLGPSLVHLADAVFHEGGDKDLDEDRPRHSRYLRVETELGVSFQTFMVMAGMPRQWEFPNGGGEWFIAADQAPFPVDWCARITSVPNQDAQLKSRRQARQLRAQVDEYDGDQSGVPSSLQEAMDAVEAQRGELAASPSTPELRVSMIFALASTSLPDLEYQAGQMRAMYEAWEYEMPRPTGNQAHLFRDMLPASTASAAARDYAQHVLPGGLASGMPIGGTRVGDPSGMVLAHTLDGGTNQPVLFDPAYGPKVNRSGSLGAFGGLGSGKSYFMKQISWATLARGGRIITLDRTASGEYVKFASVAPGTSQVVKLAANAEVCIDPLRVFDTPEDRVRYATGFLTLLTGTYPTELDGATLAEAVRAVAERPDARLADVVDQLRLMGTDHPEAAALARKISNFAQADLSSLAFGDGEPLDLHADYIVLWTPGLRLPNRDQLLNPQLAKQMLPEQVFSQACLYLIAAIGRDVTFRDQRFAAMTIDEGWSLTNSPQGRELLLEGVRDGRKHNAAIWFSSQHPDDLGDPELSSLLGIRFVFRQGPGAGAAALEFLGVDPTEQLIELVESTFDPESSGIRGQCLYRDVRDRIGRIQILPAATDELEEAFDTNPDAAGASYRDDDYRTGNDLYTLLEADQ